jgi:hypothetical protein
MSRETHSSKIACAVFIAFDAILTCLWQPRRARPGASLPFRTAAKRALVALESLHSGAVFGVAYPAFCSLAADLLFGLLTFAHL